jgi:hypothetical protein
VPDPENPPGPTVVPGAYEVELEVGGERQTARFTVVKDPRLSTTDADYAAQFALHGELVAALSKLKEALNRLRRTRSRLLALADRSDIQDAAITARAKEIADRLGAIESVMVDPQRKSVRDVLRNPAGLNDTLFDMVAMTTTADAAPTSQTREVSREVMAKVDSEVARFEALVGGELAAFNAALAKAQVAHVGSA